MRYCPTSIRSCFLFKQEVFHDDRGSLWKPFSRSDLTPEGLDDRVAEVLVVRNYQPGTLRGLHWQQHPMGQAKVISVLQGSIYDVVVDVEPGSISYRRAETFVLNAHTGTSLYVPAHCAHGYITLEEYTDVLYTLSQHRSPANERGIRWDDPLVGSVAWPLKPAVVSRRDLEWPPFKERP